MSKINRVGPWGHFGSADVRPFEPAPIDVTSPLLDTYPVNCAISNWPNQVWKAKFGRSGQPTTGIPSRGVVDFNTELFVTSRTAFIILNFCYQATQDFFININWIVSQTEGQVSRNLEWSNETIEGIDYSFNNSIPSNGELSCEIKATTFGRFRCRIQGYSDNTESVTLTASLSNT